MTVTAKSLEQRYLQAKIRSSNKASCDYAASKIMANIEKYKIVQEATRVPWWVIGIIHNLESGCNFTTHLHNGDPLSARTVRVPAGRPRVGTPPFTWEYSAIDALGLDRIDSSSLGAILDSLERYNGLGYRNGAGVATTPPQTSPYLWSMTDQYVKGKYTSDGKFDVNAVSQQVGVVALIKCLVERNAISLPPVISQGEPPNPAPSTEPGVGWFEAHLLEGAEGILEVGLVAKETRSDKTFAIARFSCEVSLQKSFRDQFPQAKTIVRAPLDKPWPGDTVTDRWQVEPWEGKKTFNRGADTQLTQNFHLSEFECKCGCRTTVLDGRHIQNMQAFRDYLKKPTHITSGYRCPAHNKAVGGATNSQHLYGNACDIVVDGMTPTEVYTAAQAYFKGIGKYVSFTHVDSRSSVARW